MSTATIHHDEPAKLQHLGANAIFLYHELVIDCVENPHLKFPAWPDWRDTLLLAGKSVEDLRADVALVRRRKETAERLASGHNRREAEDFLRQTADPAVERERTSLSQELQSLNRELATWERKGKPDVYCPPVPSSPPAGADGWSIGGKERWREARKEVRGEEWYLTRLEAANSELIEVGAAIERHSDEPHDSVNRGTWHIERDRLLGKRNELQSEIVTVEQRIRDFQEAPGMVAYYQGRKADIQSQLADVERRRWNWRAWNVTGEAEPVRPRYAMDFDTPGL